MAKHEKNNQPKHGSNKQGQHPEWKQEKGKHEKSATSNVYGKLSREEEASEKSRDRERDYSKQTKY